LVFCVLSCGLRVARCGFQVSGVRFKGTENRLRAARCTLHVLR
jgi:hypothetical protein